MHIGNGEYLIISSCIKSPYDNSKISGLIREFNEMKDVTLGNMNLLKINPNNVDFNLVWEGVDDLTTPFSMDLLNHFVLTSLQLNFNNDIPARLQVMFLDDLSYETSLIFNYTQLVEEEHDIDKRTKRLEFIEEIALVCFEKLAPIYGTFGVERSVEGIKSLIESTQEFPCDKVFYSKKLIKRPHTLLELIKGTSYRKENSAGVYLRYSDLDDFKFVESEELKMNLNELLKSL